MDHTMTDDEVKLAMRIIGLRGTASKARRNGWSMPNRKSDIAQFFPLITSLHNKGHLEIVPRHRIDLDPRPEWRLTNQGLQQLKQQIGEFHF